MIRHGARGYFVGATIEGTGQHVVKAYWSSRERKLSLDERPIRRLADYFGTLRSVVFCTEDLLLVKGAAKARRRFMDLLLAQTQPGYLALLLRYTQALRSRNALLKHHSLDEDSLAGFTHELVQVGSQLISARQSLVPRLSPLTRLAFRRIANDADDLRIDYAPSVSGDLALALTQARSRERTLRTTVLGPHRDDLEFFINDRSAAEYSSEGQKRTLAIALKMAQAELLTGIHGVSPVLLIDDVMGELDAQRRNGLLPLLNRAYQAGGQAFMTCTAESWSRELGRDFQSWDVSAGSIRSVQES